MSTSAPGPSSWQVDDGWLSPAEQMQGQAQLQWPQVPGGVHPGPYPRGVRAWQPSSDQPPTEGLASTTRGVSAHEILTVSTGSVPLDAAAGALAGYLVSPQQGARAGYALAGAAATGVFGVVGLLAVLGVAWWQGRK